MTPAQLEQLPLGISKIYLKLETDIMNNIIKNISTMSRLEYTKYLIEREYALGMSEKEIKNQIIKANKLSFAEVDKIVTDSIKTDYEKQRRLYESRNMDFIPFSESKALQQQIESIKIQTANEYANITNTMGFASEQNGTIVFNDLTSFYRTQMDTTVMAVSSGVFDYNTAMQRAVRAMTASGLRTVDYDSGAKNRVEVATRRSVMTGITQLSANISMSNAKLLGIDHYEVTAHGGARNTGSGYLNHASWQGKVYSMKGLEEICGYGQGGGLAGWNCRHSFYPFDKEIDERIYSDDDLRKMKEEESKKKSFEGKKYDTYQATQYQRELETRLRFQRQNIKLLKTADGDLMPEQVKYQATLSKYRRFSKEMDLPIQYERVKIDGLGDIRMV